VGLSPVHSTTVDPVGPPPWHTGAPMAVPEELLELLEPPDVSEEHAVAPESATRMTKTGMRRARSIAIVEPTTSGELGNAGRASLCRPSPVARLGWPPAGHESLKAHLSRRRARDGDTSAQANEGIAFQ